MYPLKQSTAITVPFFAHDASGDGVTGIADGGFTKRISKNGGAFAAMTVTITEMENGWYSLPLSTAHTDTTGILTISISSTAKRVNLQFRVHARIEDDLAFPTVSGRSMDVDASGGVEVGSFQAGAIDAAALAADAAGEIADAVWDEATAGHVAAGTFGLRIDDTITSRASSAALATVQADTDDIQARLPAALVSGRMDASVGAMAANVLTAAAINADAITAAKIAPDAIGASELAADAVAEIVDAVWNELTSEVRTAVSYGQLFKDFVDAAISSRASSAALATVQADTDDIQTRLPATLDTGRMRSVVESMNANVITAAAINADAITAAKIADGAIDAATFAAGAIDAAAIGANAIGASELAADAVAEIADAIWDELMSGHTAVGSYGQHLLAIRTGTAQAGAAGTITLDAGASATDDFYNDAVVYVTSATGAGQARLITDYVGASKVATVTPNWVTNPDATSVFVVVPAGRRDAAVAGSTDWSASERNQIRQSLGITGTTAATTGSGHVDAVKTKTDQLAFTNANKVDSAVLAAADFAAVVVTKIWDEVIAELAQATPAATPSARAAMALLYMSLRNRLDDTTSEMKIYNDAGTVIAKATLTETGTLFTRGEMVAGP